MSRIPIRPVRPVRPIPVRVGLSTVAGQVWPLTDESGARIGTLSLSRRGWACSRSGIAVASERHPDPHTALATCGFEVR